MNSLSTQNATGSSAYISKDRIGPISPANAAQLSTSNIRSKPVNVGPGEIPEMITPRGAIGNFSGIVNNQPQKYSNIMNRRKSNMMLNNTHGHVDIAHMMRANRDK